MERLPDDLSLGDTHQWLNGGWFIVRDDDGKYYPSQWDFIDEDSGYIRCIRYTPEESGYSHEWMDVRPDRVYIEWPRCGALNIASHKLAVFLERTQVRQYRRTYNANSLVLHIPRQWEAMRCTGPEIATLRPLNPEIALSAFDPEYPRYQEARDRLEEGWFSVALSPHVIIAGEPDAHWVYVGHVLTARIEDGVIYPVGKNLQHVRRLLKFFEEVRLCTSGTSAAETAGRTRPAASA